MVTKKGININCVLYKEVDGKLEDIDSSIGKKIIKEFAEIVISKGVQVQISSTSADVKQK